MSKILWFFLTISLVARADEPSNAPARVALIAETDEASAASDILTVELSKNPQIKLLERNEIDKAYREQGLSAANRDYLKLGQVLGADGLLLLRATASDNGGAPIALPSGGNSKPKIDLSVQLIAVRPGVLLTSERFSELDDLIQWAPGFATHLNPLFPKLTVLTHDAVPISIVNLRAAMQSPETREQERELTALAVERLSRERQLFVLERRKMQLLTAEKELKGMDDSAFWKGSYLLDGTMDRNGYSKDKVTISAQLVPPKGGAPLQIEVSGSRTNLSEVINQLADKVCESLKLSRTSTPWNASDEAQQYCDEARWALKWDILEEAQSASESAWALGKQDLDCALVRIRAYERGISEVDPPDIQHSSYFKKLAVVNVTAPPDPADVDSALHVLQLYDEFSRRLPVEEPNENSPYYLLGLDALGKAAGVLRHFHFHPESQKLVSESLADLRTEARNVAGWFSKSPSVRDTYWLEGSLPNHDKTYHDFELRYDDGFSKPRNFYQSELRWGCFWQENPNDCLALYRRLMSSPLFVCIHKDFWFRDKDQPRLTAWNAEDRKQVPELWRRFIAELETSTNSFLGMEARAVQFADAKTIRDRGEEYPDTAGLTGKQAIEAIERVRAEQEQKFGLAGTNLFTFILNNYAQIVAGRETLLDLDWGLGGFFDRSGVVTDTGEKLADYFRHTFVAQFGKLPDQMKRPQEIEKQKRYLAAFTPYDYGKFSKIFSRHDYSKSEAAELKPLLEAYRSNIVAQTAGSSADWFKKTRAQDDARSIDRFRQTYIDQVLDPTPTAATAALQVPAKTIATNSIASTKIESVANALVAKQFLAFPHQQLSVTNLETVIVFGQRLRDDKLLLDLRYREEWWQQETNSGREREEYPEAVAIWRPGNAWELIPLPDGESTLSPDFMQGLVGSLGQRLFVELFENALYVSDRDAIRRFDFKLRQWRKLPFPGQSRAQLFAVNSHLYAASAEGIWEILDSGQSAHILASTRRRPAASILDPRETLGHPVLFPGPGNSLCVALDGEVFSWDGNDWKSVLALTHSGPPEIFQEMALFRSAGPRQTIEFWKLEPNRATPLLCWREERGAGMRGMSGPFASPEPGSANGSPAPLWKARDGLSLARAPMAMDASTLYFYIDPSATTNRWTSNARAIQEPGRHVNLICLATNFPEPLIVPIQFDPKFGPVPGGKNNSRPNTIWMDCSQEFLFIGQSDMAGVWALPKSEIKAELERQIQQRQVDGRKASL